MSDSTAAGVPTCYRHPGRETYIRCQRCDRPICPDCMTPASVGFQCPDCVRSGHSEVRQPRMAAPWRGGAFAASPVTFVILGINVLVFLIVNVAHGNSTLLDDLMLHARGICETAQGGFLVPRDICSAHGGSYSPGVSDGGYWELLTSMFAQQAIWHIASNMFSLWVLGTQLEGLLGTRRYLALYLLSGLAGSALVYWLAAPETPTLGASGALFGLMGAYAVMALRARASLQPLVFMLALNFGITFAVSGIAWQAHVGGFIGGLAVMGLFLLTPGIRRRAWQWAGLAALLAIIVVAVITRTIDLGPYVVS